MIYKIAILLSPWLITKTSAACTRASLQDGAAAYIRAQTAGQPSQLPQAANLQYAENDVLKNISSSVLSQALTIDLHRSIFDTSSCATFTEITAATHTHPYVINTRMTFSGENITSIDSVVVDAGDWVFNATGTLYWSSRETWSPIPLSSRDSAAVIKAAGDAYLDSWADGTVRAPYGTPCARLEGGAYTGAKNPSANTCFMPEFPKPFSGAGNRRYVVDGEMGAVGILNLFPFIDKVRPEGTPSANFLRVEGGCIKYIHENTVCTTKGCGR
jgi:hypothetical protein